MRKSSLRLLGAGLVAALALTACGSSGGGQTDVKVAENPKFPAGSSMEKFAKAKKIKIGIKFDQPGIGYKKPGTDTPTGFDVAMAEIIAGGMGIEPKNIEWVETVSKNREPFLQKGTVDLVLASYSITPERRQVVGQAGPYFVTGQGLLIRKDDKSIKSGADLKGKKVCSVTGSTSLKQVEEKYGANPAPFGSYSECVTQLKNKSVDAVTTDEAILQGYAAEDKDLVTVGKPFTEERYGIGFKKGDTGMCKYLTDSINKSVSDGDWKKAFDATLGKATDVKAPAAPKPDPSCQ
ncbi:glutamate transport system substrate-binding protein [Actinopolymorpha cephalotaxi]|uniref:Glutamate transport system substrate-binding protein n=1 Tax=Actinopolymorpha cephalotaxi TaxID=504797 RepID=A0A1I2R900_9ACTN|nr:glutamate ABC transporter substrate-binding protein [Actinopolymorpha cephalotaxi]NYH82396.1 glutamate transport system substrate-binding protein [Actinopolymorpha cephalotaxi]SFG34266.1 glutamate transport system substrate-binding protein [Actinopolymorpha cephalotaxi]